jgi:type I restriction enzyme R subunit
VIWHTQGSGKSLLMAFYAGQLVREPAMENPTIVVITDRNDLDDQLFGTFGDVPRPDPPEPGSGRQPRGSARRCSRASGGVVFTTIQKFAPEKGEAYPAADRPAQRGGHRRRGAPQPVRLQGRIEKTGEIAYGFAKHLRDACRTPRSSASPARRSKQDDVNTPAVFGDYIDIYDISRAVEDGATVPIYYESRLARIELNEDEKPKIDAEIEALTEDEASAKQERLKRKWSTVEALVGSEKRLAQMVAEDLVRTSRRGSGDGRQGHGRLHEPPHLRRPLQPDRGAAARVAFDDDDAGLVKIVMTGSASDPLGLAAAYRRQGAAR